MSEKTEKIVYIETAKLKPYENNPRKNDCAVDKVAESIRQFGFKVPIVVDGDNVIVCGHTRWKAARKLGIEKVPCIIAKDLTDEQVNAFRLVDNRTHEFAEWNDSLLKEELTKLKDFDLSKFDFSIDDKNKVEYVKQIIEPYKKIYFLVECNVDDADLVLSSIENLKNQLKGRIDYESTAR